jgi:hypothetical protein
MGAVLVAQVFAVVRFIEYRGHSLLTPYNIIWHKLTDVVAGPTRPVVLSDPAASTQRFYRLITPRQP